MYLQSCYSFDWPKANLQGSHHKLIQGSSPKRLTQNMRVSASMCRFLNSQPPNRLTAVALDAFVGVAGYHMGQQYR